MNEYDVHIAVDLGDRLWPTSDTGLKAVFDTTHNRVVIPFESLENVEDVLRLIARNTRRDIERQMADAPSPKQQDEA